MLVQGLGKSKFYLGQNVELGKPHLLLFQLSSDQTLKESKINTESCDMLKILGQTNILF